MHLVGSLVLLGLVVLLVYYLWRNIPEKKVVGRVGSGYIDIYERTKEYFKAPGVFRLLKGQWNYLYPEKKEEKERVDILDKNVKKESGKHFIANGGTERRGVK